MREGPGEIGVWVSPWIGIFQEKESNTPPMEGKFPKIGISSAWAQYADCNLAHIFEVCLQDSGSRPI